MKKTYRMPFVNVVKLEALEVIATSPVPVGGLDVDESAKAPGRTSIWDRE